MWMVQEWCHIKMIKHTSQGHQSDSAAMYDSGAPYLHQCSSQQAWIFFCNSTFIIMIYTSIHPLTAQLHHRHWQQSKIQLHLDVLQRKLTVCCKVQDLYFPGLTAVQARMEAALGEGAAAASANNIPLYLPSQHQQTLMSLHRLDRSP